jgi:3-hydroxyisobutyrate dehydrogenase
LALHHKDLLICQKMAEKLNVLIPVSEMTIADYAKLMAEGYGNEDISALFRLKRH